MQFAANKQPTLEHYQSFSSGRSSAPSSRCQSPVNDADRTLSVDESVVVKQEKVRVFLQDFNDSGKFSYTVESNKTPEIRTPALVNKEKRLPPPPPPRQMTPKPAAVSKVLETPLLANLMIYNNGLIRGANDAQSSQN